MKKYLIIICTLFSIPLFAQRVATDYGDIYYEFFQFKEAAKYYEEALQDKRIQKKQYLYEQLSQCYKYLFQYARSEEYFEKLMTSGEKINPEFYIDYGNILKLNGKYKEAKAQYKKYQEVTGTDLAEPFIRSVNWAIRNADTIKNYAITMTDLNISGQSLGYCFFNNGLIYAHARNKKPIGKDMTPLFDLDYARKMSSETEFQPEMDILSQIKFDLNEGSPCVSADKQTLYFSANSTQIKKRRRKTVGAIEVSEEGVSNFKIYAAQMEDGLFQNPVALPFNDNEYSCIHPFIMEDGKTLIFSSNMPGGFGGFDLYKSILQDGGVWGEPINLGRNVNTEENELFPWVSENMLYFSSKGFNNYGGYDIYIAKLNKAVMPTGLKNLGQPINSFRDDVAFITNNGGRSGYFSTNRGNDDGDDHMYYFRETGRIDLLDTEFKSDTINDTIFASLETPKTVGEPPVKEIPTTVSVPTPAQVAIMAKQAIGADAVPVETLPSNPSTGKSKKVPSPKTTKVTSASDPATALVSPKGNKTRKNILTEPSSVPIVATTPTEPAAKSVTASVQRTSKPKSAATSIANKAGLVSNEPIDELLKKTFTPVQFEFNKVYITEPQRQVADSIAILLQANPSVKVLVAAYADSRGSFEYNLHLSERRAASVKAYLLSKGIRSNRIITKGLGEMHLLNECVDGVTCSEEQHAVNRRVEMKLVK